MFGFAKSGKDADLTDSSVMTNSTIASTADSGSMPDSMPTANSSKGTRSTVPAHSRQMQSMATTRTTDLTDSEAGIGFSDESLIGLGKRELLNLIDSLHSLGISSDLSLPQIVIVGGQSTGKSSLIEGISGVKLPRSSGTCTRCPTEIRMKRTRPNDPWRCSVKLRFEHDSGVDDIGQTRTIPFGDEITNPHDVEARIRQAQLAILNPSQSPEDYLYANQEGPSELTFSRDFITVEVFGPNVFDLSFYDLPGWIASAKDGHYDDVNLVNSLLESYIQKTNCLVLLAVACENDFETQGAYSLVRKHDPSGERTIGVLTKPDRIDTGEEDKWLKLVMNEEIMLDRGWFCVKQPDSQQLRSGMTWSQARMAEEQWFEDHVPWCDLSDEYRANLGTRKLAEYLSERLSRLIARNLPKIKGDLYNILDETENELRSMPGSISSDTLPAMLKILETFCTEVSSHVEGRPSEENGLVQLINHKRDDFKTAILSLSPRFKPYDPNEKDIRMEFTQAPPIELFDKEEQDPAHSKNSLSLHVDEVRGKIESSRTRELPGHYPYAVIKDLIKSSKGRWKIEVMAYFDEIQSITKAYIAKLVEANFKYYRVGGLNSLVEEQVQEEFRKLREITTERLEWLVNVDETLPFTQNNRTFMETKSRFLTYYKSIRYKVTNPDIGVPYNHVIRIPGYVSEALSALGKTSLRDANLTGPDLAKLIPDDGYSPALEVMAVVSAYYHVSSKRFIDAIPAAVDYDYVMGIGRNVRHALFETVLKQGNSNSRCSRLLQEAPDIIARRTYLRKKYERLEAAKTAIQDFGIYSI